MDNAPENAHPSYIKPMVNICMEIVKVTKHEHYRAHANDILMRFKPYTRGKTLDNIFEDML